MDKVEEAVAKVFIRLRKLTFALMDSLYTLLHIESKGRNKYNVS